MVVKAFELGPMIRCSNIRASAKRKNDLEKSTQMNAKMARE